MQEIQKFGNPTFKLTKSNMLFEATRNLHSINEWTATLRMNNTPYIVVYGDFELPHKYIKGYAIYTDNGVPSQLGVRL